MRTAISKGAKLPSVNFGELRGGEVTSVSSTMLFANRRTIVIGVPAAFSPICSQLHLPGFIENAPKLLKSGFDAIACIASNDPWVLDTWRKSVDPGGHIRFLSDGNLEFGKACLLTTEGADVFVGERLRRFTMIVSDGFIERLAIEPFGFAVTCTSAAHLGLCEAPDRLNEPSREPV